MLSQLAQAGDGWDVTLAAQRAIAARDRALVLNQAWDALLDGSERIVLSGVADGPQAARYDSDRHALIWDSDGALAGGKRALRSSDGVCQDGRPARHLEALRRANPADDAPLLAYPDAASLTLAQGYALAHDEIARTVGVAAHERLNELQRLLQRSASLAVSLAAASV
jgi:hypothetical protein